MGFFALKQSKVFSIPTNEIPLKGYLKDKTCSEISKPGLWSQKLCGGARARYIDTGIKYHHHRRHPQPRSVAAAITPKIKRGVIKRAKERESVGSSFRSQTSPTFVGNSIMSENIPRGHVCTYFAV